MDQVQNDLLPRFADAIDWSLWTGPGRPVVCALSGGPDSMALCDLLDRLSKETPFRIIAAHLNHGLRGDESDADETFVREFCRSREIRIEVHSLKGAVEQAKSKRLSLEMMARKMRRAFFLSTAMRLGCTAITLGHTADDRIELLIMRLFRGSGGRGLGSLRSVSEQGNFAFLRPLLAFHRPEILAYLEYRNMAFRIDQSNLTLDTDRGKVRNLILPELEKLALSQGWKNIRKPLTRSAALLADDEDFIDSLLARFLEPIEIAPDETLRFPIDPLASLPSPVLGRLILTAVGKLDPAVRLERRHIKAVEEMFTSLRDKPFNIPGALTVERENDFVIVRAAEIQVSHPLSAVRFSSHDLPLEVDFGLYRISFSLRASLEHRIPLADAEGPYPPVSVDLGNSESLLIRPPQPGDRIAPLGMDNHTRKLSDIFIDKKIPRFQRPWQPVLVDETSGAILALPTLGIVSESSAVGVESTRILTIQTSVLPPRSSSPSPEI